MQLVMFSKHLQEYSIRKAGETAKGLGLEGLDLTVRPKGHVEPERVKTDLPKAVAELKEVGAAVPMITTGIVSASDPAAKATFATAQQLGIRYLKLGYWNYKPFGKLRDQLDEAKRQLDGVEKLAAEHKVCACLHTHSGNYLTATAAGMFLLLDGRCPDQIGAYLDPGHLTVEGGAGGWRQALDLLQGHIRLIAIKDFGWFKTGSKEWKEKLVPLNEGVVKWPEVFAALKQVGFDGPVSLHSEYQGDHSWKDLKVEELVSQTRADLAYLRPVIAGAGYPTRG